MNLPVAIDPAPAYTEKLIKQFTDNNYTLKTLERDKADLKEDGKNSNGKLGSDELKKIDYNIESKEQHYLLNTYTFFICVISLPI